MATEQTVDLSEDSLQQRIDQLASRVESGASPDLRAALHRLRSVTGAVTENAGRHEGVSVGTGLASGGQGSAQELAAGGSADLQQLLLDHSQVLLAAQRQILNHDKLASVGRLAAGIAHEINTPIQYVGDNLRALADSFRHVWGLIERYRGLVERIRAGQATPQDAEEVRAAEQECDLDYILADTPQAIQQSLEGLEQVASIVRAMRVFSHEDGGETSLMDLNRSLQSMLTVARNEYKHVADVDVDLGELPVVECYASELNQVFLNLLINAVDAVRDTNQRGRITIRTRSSGEWVEIAIADTGTGIPEAIQSKVFEPFFTTKPVGKGTGQGLSIAHQIVVCRHHGSITFESRAGLGTTFFVRLPVHREMADPVAVGG